LKSTLFSIKKNKIIILLKDRVCENADELLNSDLFKEVVRLSIKKLKKNESKLLNIFNNYKITDETVIILIETIQYLAKVEADLIPKIIPGSEDFLEDRNLFSEYIEYLYNFWRSFDRFIICDSVGTRLDKRPYRTFNSTIEQLTHLVRKSYRDIEETITNKHPRVYRQVHAGAEVATIARQIQNQHLNNSYQKLNEIPIIRQVLLYPPLIFDPPMNKRKGIFQEVTENPINLIDFQKDEWLCFPIKVGTLLINVYFRDKFFEIGFGLANLFELAEDNEIKKKPDAVYFYGVGNGVLDKFSDHPTVYYNDQKRDMLVGAVPDDDKFGYFGYLKKMILTLHNIKMMQKGIFPFHGAMYQITLKSGRDATILMIGDSGAGKSESLEALRMLGEEKIKDLTIIADDMGSIQLDSEGKALGYGSEIGAFLRLDDLQPGYAFGQLDRAIITNPNKINARIVIPVTYYETINKGFRIDVILYANNYENVDDDHPILDFFDNYDAALRVFKDGTVMSKGTTAKTGLTHSYFANVFGPPQNKKLHEKLANKYFKAFFDAKIHVGQIRTRLGIENFETSGPADAAEKLLEFIENM